MVKVPPLAVPQLGSCASSGRAWRLWPARRSQGEAQPLGVSPLLRVLERAASKAADFPAFDHPGAPSQPKRTAEDDAEAAEAERKSKRGRKRQPEAKPGMPTVFRRSHNLEVAVAPRTYGVGHGAELQAFLQEQLYGAGVKRIASTSFSSLTRASARLLRTPSRAGPTALPHPPPCRANPPCVIHRAGAATNFATAAPPPNRVTKPKKAKVDPATKLTGRVQSASSTAMDRRAAKLMRG